MQIPGAVSAGIKRQGREADRTPPGSADAKKAGVIPPSYVNTPNDSFTTYRKSEQVNAGAALQPYIVWGGGRSCHSSGG
jgi:hypothetical protein